MVRSNTASRWELTRGIFQVPVIAVFTKYDQFKREVNMKLEDQHRGRDSGPLTGTNFDAEMDKIFNEHYLADLVGSPPFVRLESEDLIMGWHVLR
jgi:hypothetical protein